MVYAQLYRRDLISGEPDHAFHWVIIRQGGIPDMHDEATRIARYYGADAYKLYQGNHFKGSKAISLKHVI